MPIQSKSLATFSCSVGSEVGSGFNFCLLTSFKATAPKKINGIPIPSPNPRPRARSLVPPVLGGGEVRTGGRSARAIGVVPVAVGDADVVRFVVKVRQRLAGVGTTCHTSPAIGTTAHVVAPAHCTLAHSGKQAVCAVTGTPCRTYRHTVPGAQPAARLLDVAKGKALSWTERPLASVSFVKPMRGVTDGEADGGAEVLMPSAKTVGSLEYNTPASARKRAHRYSGSRVLQEYRIELNVELMLSKDTYHGWFSVMI